MDGDGEKEIEASQRESVGHFQSAERLVSLNFYCKVHYIMCIKICRWNIFGGVPALLATIYMYIYIYICIYISLLLLFLLWYIYRILLQMQKCTRGGGSPPTIRRDSHGSYPLVNIQKAIENGHRNSGFSH